MKIRNGFVSNSSSSNFIVSSSAHDSVYDLSKAMIEIRDDSYDEGGFGSNSEEIGNLNQAIKDGRDINENVTFSSCSYDTFIKKIEGAYIVTSCTNVPFTTNLSIVSSLTEQTMQWLRSNGYLHLNSESWSISESIDSWEFQKKESFWHINYNLVISRFDYMEEGVSGYEKAYCKDNGHFGEKVILVSTGEIICPVCYLKSHPKIDDPDDIIKSRFDILDF